MNKAKNKAQISAQVFVYILAAVIAGVIMLVGYKGIRTVLDAQENAQIDTFIDDLKNDISSVARQYNSVKKVELRLPEKYNKICFVDSMENGEYQSNVNDSIPNTEYPQIKNTISNNVAKNLFLMHDKKILKDDYIDNVDVEQNFLCLTREDKLVIWLKGLGKKALLYKNEEGSS